MEPSINPFRIGIEASITSRARVKSLSIGMLLTWKVKMMKARFIVQEGIKKQLHLTHSEIVPGSKMIADGTRQNRLIDSDQGAAHRILEVLPSPRSSKTQITSSIKMIHNCTTSLVPSNTNVCSTWETRITTIKTERRATRDTHQLTANATERETHRHSINRI